MGTDRWSRVAGFTVVDLLIALGVSLLVSALAAPPAVHLISVARGRHAAAVVSSRIRLARVQAIASRRNTAVLFDQAGARWTMRVCQDGNDNGVRRAEIASGVDACSEGPTELPFLVPGADFAIDPTIGGPDGDPPGPNPVRFGSSQMTSCSPSGGCTPGSVFIRADGREQFAVRLGSMTGRARVLRYHPAIGTWRLE